MDYCRTPIWQIYRMQWNGFAVSVVLVFICVPKPLTIYCRYFCIACICSYLPWLFHFAMECFIQLSDICMYQRQPTYIYLYISCKSFRWHQAIIAHSIWIFMYTFLSAPKVLSRWYFFSLSFGVHIIIDRTLSKMFVNWKIAHKNCQNELNFHNHRWLGRSTFLYVQCLHD